MNRRTSHSGCNCGNHRRSGPGNWDNPSLRSPPRSYNILRRGEMNSRGLGGLIYILAAVAGLAPAATSVDQPFAGVTHITRTETSPRPQGAVSLNFAMCMVCIRCEVSAPGGTLE